MKYLESAGARVVPIFYTSNATELTRIFNGGRRCRASEFERVCAGLNGVLFAGGSASLAATSAYFKSAQVIYDLAIKANANKDFFPLWVRVLNPALA